MFMNDSYTSQLSWVYLTKCSFQGLIHFVFCDVVFNTDNNHSVVQTYNFITYKHCDFNNAQDNDTTEWLAGDQSATAVGAVTVAVPLLKEGMTYFFSGFYDGEQCKHGQRFKVNVTHGQGLPESLKNPSNESPGPTSQESGGDDESAPETVVPSNFNNPQGDGSDTDVEASRSVSLIEYSGFLDGKLNGVVILLWLISIVWFFVFLSYFCVSCV